MNLFDPKLKKYTKIAFLNTKSCFESSTNLGKVKYNIGAGFDVSLNRPEETSKPVGESLIKIAMHHPQL